MILRNTRLRNDLKRIACKHDSVEDILLFGSAAREKARPGDIDVLILFREKVDKKIETLIRCEFKKYCREVSTVSKTVHSVTEASFDARESVLFEARSFLTGDNLAERYGFSSLGLFRYQFGDWTNLKKTKFYHAFNGRGTREGVSGLLGCIKLSDNVVLVPLKSIDEFREFLELWKLRYIYSPMLIPGRMARKDILEK